MLTALVEARRFSAITVMIQREVALRIAAAPGTADYGAFSVYMQYHTEPEVLFDVPPSCFLPAPKVTSRRAALPDPDGPGGDAPMRGGILLPDRSGRPSPSGARPW